MPPSPTTVYMSPSRIASGAFAPGAAFTNGNAITVLRPCAGVARGRVRFKASAAGTLVLTYVSPDGATDYTTPTATSVAIVANTEKELDFTPYGEAYYKLTFTPSAGGTVTYCDECGL